MLPRTPACLVLLLACLLACGATSAGEFQNKVDDMLGDMTNTTNPGAWESARRGGFTGGSLVNRSKIMNQDLVSFRPPSFSAGCGGIDMFAGSFSFINQDQLVQMMRSVASNAKGYAFQIALEAMCPECARQIESFQKKVQKLNQYFGNSCQMAKGIVDNTMSAMKKKNSQKASNEARQGGSGDSFQTNTNTDGKTPKQKAKTAVPGEYDKQILGNLIWRKLTQNNVGKWFTGSSSEKFREVIMSYTGSFVIQPVGTSGQTTTVTLPPKDDTIGLRELVMGGSNLEIYDCPSGGAHDCVQISSNDTQTVDLTGFHEKITNLLLGSPSSVGVVKYWAANHGGTITNKQKALVTSLPYSLGGKMQSLALRQEAAARAFIQQQSKAISLYMARQLVRRMLDATRRALVQGDHAYKKKAIQTLNAAQESLRSEYKALKSSMGTIKEIQDHYNSTVKYLPSQSTAQAMSSS